MKRKYIFVIVLLLVMTAASAVICLCMGRDGMTAKEDGELLIVTSFHPVYVAVQNVTDGVEGVRVEALSQPLGGCVHDHQLTTKDLMLLEQADVFIINGAGMESYLHDVMKRYPDLEVIDSSVGTSLLEEGEEHHHEEAEEHDHAYNSHIWLNMDNYCIQIGNIGNGLADCDKGNKEQYQRNAASYQEKVRALQEKGKKELAGAGSLHAVSTHEAFSYLAQNFDAELEETINMDENTSLDASDVSEVMEAVLEHQIPYVWTEEIYGTSLSQLLEQETDCKTLVLDTLVSGDSDKDAYLRGMQGNIEVLKEAMRHE